MTRSISTGAYVLRLTLTLFLITTIVAGLLGLVNYVTADTIAEQIAQKAENAMRQVLEAGSYEPLDVPENSTVTAAMAASCPGVPVQIAAAHSRHTAAGTPESSSCTRSLARSTCHGVTGRD